MKIHLIFNTDRLKSYYEKTFEVERNQSEVIEEIEK